jgi:hypothetical protein
MPRGSHVYLALSFNIERAEDLDLLSWLYAQPVTRRGAAIKHLLRAGLPGYLHAQHPESTPLDHQAVRDLVATRARARRRRRGEPADADRRRAPAQAAGPNHELSPSGTPGPSLEERTRKRDRTSSGDAEVRPRPPAPVVRAMREATPAGARGAPGCPHPARI